jgi:outer membrane lipoprotein carrier protein
MLHKLILTFSILLGITVNTYAQQTLSKQESQTLKENVVKKSETTSSIISSFKQYKHLDFLSKDIVSSGKLTFKAPNTIKWEYKTPFKYSVIFKDDQLLINDNGDKSEIDLSANKAFKQLNNLIIKSVKGDMFDESQFDISYAKDKNYVVKFNPKDKDLKSFISSFEITFDKNSFDVLSVKMLENSEDYTLIKFIDQKLNNPVSDAVFSH